VINYYLLTKPGIVLGNLFPLAAGFLLASRGTPNLSLFLATLLGLALIMASGCLFNNYIDRPLDAKMKRTQNRPFVKGTVSLGGALFFGLILFLAGNGVLFAWTNLLTVAVADFGFFVYVVLYSLWKSRTIYGTAIGSVAGAIPPVVGYCAVRGHLDGGALILFTMLVLWQMPHFFAIALFRLNDYAAAGIPVLPLEKGLLRTQIHMVLYIIAFTCAASLLTFFHYTGFTYLLVTTCLNLLWLIFCLRGFTLSDSQAWGKQMFRLSLVLILSICLLIPFDVVT